MLAKIARLIEMITGSVLGGLAVSVQSGNVIVCVFCLVVMMKAFLSA